MSDGSLGRASGSNSQMIGASSFAPVGEETFTAPGAGHQPALGNGIDVAPLRRSGVVADAVGAGNQNRPSDGIVGATANVQEVSGEPVAPVRIRRQPD